MPGFYAPTDPLGLTANLSQSLYTFGKLKGGVKLAEQAVAQARLDLEEETRQLVVLVKRAFFGYLLALEVQGINRETLERKLEALEVARLRYGAGQVSDYEVLRAESDLENYRATVIGSDNAVRIALLNVRGALGIQEEEFEFQLVGQLEPLAFVWIARRCWPGALQRKYELASFRGRHGPAGGPGGAQPQPGPAHPGGLRRLLPGQRRGRLGEERLVQRRGLGCHVDRGAFLQRPGLRPVSLEQGERRDPQVGPAAGKPAVSSTPAWRAACASPWRAAC